MWVRTVTGVLNPKNWSLYNFTRFLVWMVSQPGRGSRGEQRLSEAPGTDADRKLKKLHVDLLFLSESSDHRGESPGDALARIRASRQDRRRHRRHPQTPEFHLVSARSDRFISACHGELTAADNARAVSAQQRMAW